MQVPLWELWRRLPPPRTKIRCWRKHASMHQSLSLASEINWLRVWKAARDRGPFWTNICISQTFDKLLTKERNCHKYDSSIPADISFFSHLTQITSPTLWTSTASWQTSAQRTLIQTLTLFITWDHLSLCFIPILIVFLFYYVNTIYPLHWGQNKSLKKPKTSMHGG